MRFPESLKAKTAKTFFAGSCDQRGCQAAARGTYAQRGGRAAFFLSCFCTEHGFGTV